MSRIHWILYFIGALLETVFRLVGILFWSFLPSLKRKSICQEIVLITGGGHGIGREIALAFAHHKPKHIVIWGRKKSYLDETASLISKLGVSCLPMICDVSCAEDICVKAEEVSNRVGSVSILVNNAGVVFGKQLLDTSDSDILQTFRVNTLAHLYTIKQFLPSMIENRRGHLVSINSILGMVGLRGATDYCSSKFASSGISASLCQELEDYPDIHVTSVHPYQVNNDMFSGVTIRFPWLFPILTEEYVAQKTVNAVLVNKKQILLPRIWYFIVWMQSLLPVSTLLPVLKFTGAATCMETFHKPSSTLQPSVQHSTAQHTKTH
ncbi:hypothetical protein ScPMuIL_008679 [Solemya velum]